MVLHAIALRDAFESMGSTVKWDNETQTVTVEDPARISNYYDRETYVNGAIWQLLQRPEHALPSLQFGLYQARRRNC